MTTVTDINKHAQTQKMCALSPDLVTQISTLKSEVVSLQKDVMDLRERIGAVRGWIKNSLLIFSVFCIMVISGHYYFLLQLPDLESNLKVLNEKIGDIIVLP